MGFWNLTKMENISWLCEQSTVFIFLGDWVMDNLVEHHVKYKEIHGIDETVWMTRSEHLKLHRRLRQESKCNIPVKKLKKIALAASGRTIKQKKLQKEWVRSNRYKEIQKRYRNEAREYLVFYETIAPNCLLREELQYNSETGNITYASFFVGNHGLKLYGVNI